MATKLIPAATCLAIALTTGAAFAQSAPATTTAQPPAAGQPAAQDAKAIRKSRGGGCNKARPMS